ncbi:MAG: hypothetical protein ABW042_06705 [Phenylobacterium sp.]
MDPIDRYRLLSRRRRVRRQLATEMARPVADLALVRRLLRRCREVAQALADADRAA